MILQKNISNIFGSNTKIDISRNLRLKSISIIIYKNYIKVRAPFLFSNKKIDELLKKKFNWIKKNLAIQQNILSSIKKKYINGEEFKYLGKTYILKIIKDKNYNVKIKDNLLIVTTKNTEDIIKIRRLISKWFHEKSAVYFNRQTLFYAKENKIKVAAIKIREYKSRWGSCSIDSIITFNWRLIMAPPHVIKYVIIHELMHIKEYNHSPEYWRLVESLYPNKKKAQYWLIYNGKTLTIN